MIKSTQLLAISEVLNNLQLQLNKLFPSHSKYYKFSFVLVNPYNYISPFLVEISDTILKALLLS